MSKRKVAYIPSRELDQPKSAPRPQEPTNIRLKPIRLPEMEPIKGRGFNQNGPAS